MVVWAKAAARGHINTQSGWIMEFNSWLNQLKGLEIAATIPVVSKLPFTGLMYFSIPWED